MKTGQPPSDSPAKVILRVTQRQRRAWMAAKGNSSLNDFVTAAADDLALRVNRSAQHAAYDSKSAQPRYQSMQESQEEEG